MKIQKFRVTSPAPREVWESLLKDRNRDLVFATPKWMDCITESEGMKDASRFYEFSNGKQAILPLAGHNISFRLFSVQGSMPHGWGMGDLITQPDLEENEMDAILDDLKGLGLLQGSIRPNPLEKIPWEQMGNVFDYTITHSTHILDISDGFEHYWSKILDSAKRNKIHKAEKSGLVVERSQTEKAVEDFYKIYLKWTADRARRHRIPISLCQWLAKQREPLEKFRVVSRILRDSCQVWTTKLDYVPVSAACLLIHNKHAFYWRSYSDKSLAGPTRANELLQKFMIEEACKQGCLFYHMGESGDVLSLINYKEKFGAVRYFYREYFWGNFPIAKIQQPIQKILKKVEKMRMTYRGEESSHEN